MRQRLKGRGVTCFAALTFCFVLVASAWAADGVTISKTDLRSKQYKPLIAFHEVPETTSDSAVTVSGVVFSRSPIARVQVGERVAKLREAMTADLVSFKAPPKGAAEAPHRTFFELPDAELKTGANDIVVQAVASDGRRSNVHRVTILRSKKAKSTDESEDNS